MCQQCYKEKIHQPALRRKIVQTFESLEALRILCADLEQTLHSKRRDEQLNVDMLTGSGLEGKVLSLIEFFAQREMLPDLIEVVCNKRPQLKHYDFYVKDQPQRTASVHQNNGVFSANRLLTPQHFDLSKLVKIFLNIVRESQGILGFAIPCDYSEFHNIFCRRIKDEFDRLEEFEDNVDMRGMFTLEYRRSDQLISKIKSIKDQNPRRYITIPIKLDKSNTQTPELFWQMAYSEFQKLTDHIIIIIMTGRSDCTFPECMTKLTPLFTEKDIQDWQLRIGTLQAWSPHAVKECWKEYMLQECSREDRLDIELIYNHMNKVKGILQSHPRPSFENFFDLLEHESGEENIYS